MTQLERVERVDGLVTHAGDQLAKAITDYVIARNLLATRMCNYFAAQRGSAFCCALDLSEDEKDLLITLAETFKARKTES